MAIWDTIKELERLQRKAASGKDIEDKDTFIVRAALKERGWEGLVCEEAVSRGYKEHRGEEVGLPSWFIKEAKEIVEESKPEKETGRSDYDYMLDTPEVQGDEAPEKEQDLPRRLFNLLGDTPGEKSEEQEEVREEGLEEPPYAGLGLSEEAQLAALEKEKTMKTARNDGLPSMSEYDMARKEMEKVLEDAKYDLEYQVHTPARQRVIVGDEIGWLCKACNRVWGLEEETCSVCKRSPDYETVFPAAKQVADKAIAEALGKKKTDKELAIELMFKALGVEPEYRPDLKVEVPEGAIECEHCHALDYLECDCCIECESEECVCCDNCSLFPCQCDKEECPICHGNIPIGDACPNGCDSDIRELQQLYDDVKNSQDLGFGEKVKFMALLKEKMGLAADDNPDPDQEPGFEEEPYTEEEDD